MVYEASWQGRPVAVKKLPQLTPDQPFSEQLYEALLREIQLASKFDCDRCAAATSAGASRACVFSCSAAGPQRRA